MTKKKNNQVKNNSNKSFDWNIHHNRHEIFHKLYNEAEEEIAKEKELKIKKQKD